LDYLTATTNHRAAAAHQPDYSPSQLLVIKPLHFLRKVYQALKCNFHILNHLLG